MKFKGNYKDLLVYKKTECIYDITYFFTEKYYKKGDRTIDQMVQAARSGKQNIVEGSVDASTSSKMEIKLYNTALGSLHELLRDYEDYLRVHGLKLWDSSEPRYEALLAACRAHNDSEYYREAMPTRSDEGIANTAITPIHQADYLLRRLIDSAMQRFLNEGGFTEQLYHSRRDHRDGHDNKK